MKNSKIKKVVDLKGFDYLNEYCCTYYYIRKRLSGIPTAKEIIPHEFKDYFNGVALYYQVAPEHEREFDVTVERIMEEFERVDPDIDEGRWSDYVYILEDMFTEDKKYIKWLKKWVRRIEKGE